MGAPAPTVSPETEQPAVEQEAPAEGTSSQEEAEAAPQPEAE